MRELHYRNIGFPKTGTTWLWLQLMSHPEIDGKFDHSVKEFHTADKEKYNQKYLNFNKTVNLNTYAFLNPDQLTSATHLSFIFRNPYELLTSWFNYLKNTNPNIKMSAESYLSFDNSNFKMFTNVSYIFDIIQRYDVKYFFYDDLKLDNKQFFYNICDFLGIKKIYDARIQHIFKTEIKEPLEFSYEIKKYVNESIHKIEDFVKRDLSNWKKQ
jgi:hypothetical protein